MNKELNIKISKVLLIFSLLYCNSTAISQEVEVIGKLQVTVMDTVNMISSNVVRQSDGTLAVRAYNIGDFAHGGLIFYLDESGEHGLVADTSDLIESTINPFHRWYAGTNGYIKVLGDGIYAGDRNTTLIISGIYAQGDDEFIYAARACAENQQGGFGDWYLPSLEELDLMRINLHQDGLGNFTSEEYWSSNEWSSTQAWRLDFSNGGITNWSKSSYEKVRAIRAF